MRGRLRRYRVFLRVCLLCSAYVAHQVGPGTNNHAPKTDAGKLAPAASTTGYAAPDVSRSVFVVMPLTAGCYSYRRVGSATGPTSSQVRGRVWAMMLLQARLIVVAF